MINPDRKAKIIWRCRRGMLELDLLFQRFTRVHLDKLNESELLDFELLLSEPDPDIYSWLMGCEEPENKAFDHIIKLIQLQCRLQPVK